MQFIASFTGIHTLAWGLPHNGMEWIVIGVIALLIFGKRIPTMARGIGQGIKEFKSGLKSGEQEADALFFVEIFDDLENLLDDLRREPHRRLVEQDHLRPRHQRAADGAHLLLAA